MQIQMDDIKTHVSGFCGSDDRVQVCAVVVKESAGIVYGVCYFQDVSLEKTLYVVVRARAGRNDDPRHSAERNIS